MQWIQRRERFFGGLEYLLFFRPFSGLAFAGDNESEHSLDHILT